MTFLDDVDSLKAKVGIGSTSPLVLFGLSAVIIAVVLSIGFMALGGVLLHLELWLSIQRNRRNLKNMKIHLRS